MVTKQVTGIVVDKSIEDIDSIIHECTEKLSTNDIISKSQVISMLRKIRSFEIPDEVFDNQSSAEYYAKELLKIGFLENVKQIFRTILNKPNFLLSILVISEWKWNSHVLRLIHLEKF